MNPLLIASSAALAGVSVAALHYGVAESAGSRAQLLAARYTQNLDDTLRRMLLPPRGRVILYVQCLALGLSLLAAAALRAPAVCLCIPLVLAAPRFALRVLRKRRRDAIEAKLDGFALALANALRASPSIGRALQTLQSTLPSPIAGEVAQVLGELRVGSSVEQALLNFSWRVQSDPLDALLSSVLVARRIGGSLPETLETTAATLREMARLEGLLRSKTAQSRMQIWVLGCLPPVLVLAFDRVNPGYFDVLTASALGLLVIAVAVLCWFFAVVLARKLMAVEL
jgi:tight adherence protein B